MNAVPDLFNTYISDAQNRAKAFANYEAEMAVLGGILVQNDAIAGVADILAGEHFSDARHGLIFDAIAKIQAHGQVADPITLKAHFEATGELDALGGTTYLARLVAANMGVYGLRDYAGTILDRWKRRRVAAAAAATLEDLSVSPFHAEIDDIAAKLQGTVEQTMWNAGVTGPVTVSEAGYQALEAAERAFKSTDGLVGLPSHLTALDRILNGFTDGQLILLAGRPGMGKSTVSANVSFKIGTQHLRAREGTPFQRAPVFVWSGEMSAAEYGICFLAATTGISPHLIRSGRLSDEDWPKLFAARDEMKNWSIHIDETPGLYVSQIEARARRLKPSIMFIDHLGLLDGAVPGERIENRTQQVSMITKALKQMAKRLKIPVIALSQLSRDVEKRAGGDRRPHLSDLRDSGSLEQDADVVIFAYRTMYYLNMVDESDRDEEWHKRADEARHVLELIVAKQRMGPCETAKVYYDPVFGQVGDL